MSAIEAAALVSLVLSLLSIPLLLLVLSPSVLPSRVSGIPKQERLSAASGSLLIVAIFYSGSSVLGTLSKGKTRSTVCSVDAVLKTYLVTTISSHLAVITLDYSSSIPTPSLSDPPVASTGRSAISLSLAYGYGLLPLLPTLTTAASAGWKLSEGFGMWWGVYCIDRSSWFRIVHPVTLLPPLLLTIILCFMALSALYVNVGQLSDTVRPTSRQWLTAIYPLLCATAFTAYLVVEQLMGWKADWWPRVFEAPIPLLISPPHACNSGVWRTWSYWIRFKSVSVTAAELPTARSSGQTRRGSGYLEKNVTTQYTSSSSFFVPAIPIHDTYVKPPSQPPVFKVVPTCTYPDHRRAVAGRHHYVSPASEIPSETPPFIYSMTNTLDTGRSRSTAELFSASSSRSTSSVLSPQETSQPPLQPHRLPEVILPPKRRVVDDGMSMDSRYSEISGVTSVFATRDSVVSSLPTTSPSTCFRLHRESLCGEIVFSGDQAGNIGSVRPSDLLAVECEAESKLSLTPSRQPVPSRNANAEDD